MTWLVIQPPTKWKEGLKIVDLDKTDYPFALHLRAISSAAATMWEYLEDISNELTELVGLFSSYQNYLVVDSMDDDKRSVTEQKGVLPKAFEKV